MIREFGNKIAFDLFHYGRTKKLPNEYWQRGIYLLDIMDAIDINKLSGWRITFKFIQNNFCDVKIEDYH